MPDERSRTNRKAARARYKAKMATKKQTRGGMESQKVAKRPPTKPKSKRNKGISVRGKETVREATRTAFRQVRKAQRKAGKKTSRRRDPF